MVRVRKGFIERLRGAGGCTVDKYIGDGQAESASVGSEGGTLYAGPEVERQKLKEDTMIYNCSCNIFSDQAYRHIITYAKN